MTMGCRSKSTMRVRRWRDRNRQAVREYDRRRKAADRRLNKAILGITHKERARRKTEV
jgi:hypothetical protein